MENNFSIDEIRRNIIYHRERSKQWLSMFNLAEGKNAKEEFEEKSVYHCNRLLSWQALFERVTGKPYYPDPEADPHKTVKDA